jgi:hypothetical protein
MVRIRHGWLVALIGLALPLASACKKDDKKSDTAAGVKSDKTGGPAEKAAAKTDDLSLLPVDSEIVVGINFAQVQASPLWKQFIEPKIMTGEVTGKMAEFKAKCGFDPMGAIKSISAGIKPTGNNAEGRVVIHGIDKGKAWACMDANKEEMVKDGTEYTREGDVGLMKNKNGGTFGFTFLDDSTLLGVFGEVVNADTVKGAAAGGSALKSSAAFVDMYSKVNTGDSLWFLVNGKVLDRGQQLGVKAKAVFGSINVTDGLATDIRVRAESPDAAAGLATLLKSQGQQVGKMVDKLDVGSDGAEVKVSVVMSKQKLDALITQFGGMMGMFGGGTP